MTGANSGRHGFCLGTQHIYIRIVNRLIELGSLTMHQHFGGLITGRLKSAYDTGPQQTTGAKLGNFHRSEEHTSELQSRPHLVCRLLLEKKKNKKNKRIS